MTDPLAAQITAQQPLDNGVRIGEITSVLPMVVTVGGAVVDAGKLRSYQPLVGDTVALLRQDNAWLVLGAVDPADAFRRGSIIGANVATITGFQAHSTVAGTEVAFASASWNISESVYVFQPGEAYLLSAQIAPISNGAGASQGAIRIRKGAATITGQVLMHDYVIYPAGFAGLGRSQWTRQYIVNQTANVISTKLSLTSTLGAGAGSASIYGGDNNSATMFHVAHVGPFAQQPGLVAGSFASIV